MKHFPHLYSDIIYTTDGGGTTDTGKSATDEFGGGKGSVTYTRIREGHVEYV